MSLRKAVHQASKGIGEDIEALQFNKAVAKIYALTATIEKAPVSQDRQHSVAKLIRIIAPMMPHLAEEAWENVGPGLIADATWPSVDPALLVEDEVTVAVQVMGKLRHTLTLPKGTSEQNALEAALESPKVRLHVGYEPLRRVIFVEDRLLNIIPGRVMKPA